MKEQLNRERGVEEETGRKGTGGGGRSIERYLVWNINGRMEGGGPEEN